jgi:FKBP12-rapamycin complex-associated protein
MLKFKIQTICMKLLNLLLAGTELDTVNDKIFNIFNLIKELNVFFPHLVLPRFCRILNNTKGQENTKFLVGIIKYIESILDFEYTLQYTSTIVHALIACIQDNEEVANACRDCILKLIATAKEHSLIYLPLISSAFNANSFRNDKSFKTIIDKLVDTGDFDSIAFDLEFLPLPKSKPMEMGALLTGSLLSTTEDNESRNSFFRLNDLIKPFNSESVKNLFDTSNNYLKEDWEEWLTKACNELLVNSPSKVLSLCKSFAHINPNISKDLFNVGFAMIWSQFSESQKATVIQNIEKTISNQNVPLSVLKVILNLTEFMEHDKEGLPLDITAMASLAEKCNAHAKAVYYRELDFIFCPEDTVESLISLYMNLGQPEAASGMLEYARSTLKISVDDSWLEALGRWEDALKRYSEVDPPTKTEHTANMKNKIRCWDALTQWEQVVEESELFVLENIDIADISQYAAKACIQLGKWELLEKFTERINTRKDDNNYYEAIISIHKGDFEAAKVSIKKSRKHCENFLVGINKQTYFNNYDRLVRLQILSEMEEIISFHEYAESVKADQSKGSSGYEEDSYKRLLYKRKVQLLEMWSDRIEGTAKNPQTWLDIISVRSLLFKKWEMMPVMLRFARLAVKKNNYKLVNRIYSDLEQDLEAEVKRMKNADMSKNEGRPIIELQSAQSADTMVEVSRRRNTSVDSFVPLVPLISKPLSRGATISPRKSKTAKFDLELQYELPSEFYLAKFEKMFKLKELNSEQIYDVMTDFFQNVTLDPELEAVYSRKLGSWLAESLTEESQKGFDKVLSLFKKSLKMCSKEVETWHLFALTNYKRIHQLTNNRERQVDPNSEQMQTLIRDSFEGFMNSISIGGPDFTEALQDTLKLLEILFKFGDQPNIFKLMNEKLTEVDITCWLNVVPQLIAKLDVGNDVIHESVMRLLEHVDGLY